MISAAAVIDDSLCLVELDVNGHADFAERGSDIVCSAVSVLVRTAGRIVLSQLLNGCEYESDGKGSFQLKLVKIPDGKQEWMRGITEFLLNGLSDLEKDYPAFVKLEITINEE
ncbi:MAG: ribosomal-processing cysteine protease Prp [Spirochaetaceae bacterium]|nr:ribosomal-processing cysteine protease Prp [Spirochaetaceae bacterium]